VSERRIVPDNSTMIPAFFHETLTVGGNPFDMSARARPIAEAIRLGRVNAFAPDALPIEFLDVAHRKAKPPNAAATIIANRKWQDSQRHFTP
jgi:hypothetical protein